MTGKTMPHPTIYPALRYEDAGAAIDFLVEAFGFRVRARYENPDGSVAHAELELGSGIVMLGTQKDDVLRTRDPRAVGGVTCSIYVVVEDPDAHYEQALARGAEVVLPIRDTDYGSREYGVRDLEGHLWSFGTYDPYAAG